MTIKIRAEQINLDGVQTLRIRDAYGFVVGYSRTPAETTRLLSGLGVELADIELVS